MLQMRHKPRSQFIRGLFWQIASSLSLLAVLSCFIDVHAIGVATPWIDAMMSAGERRSVVRERVI